MRRVRHVMAGAAIGMAAIGVADTVPVAADHGHRDNDEFPAGAVRGQLH